MINISNILRSALFISAFFLPLILFGQNNNKLKLLPGSDFLEFNDNTGNLFLRGNVNFEYQNNVMYCDSAYYNEKNRTVRAYGNVHINKKDTLNLFCDSLNYNGKTRRAKLWGNVRVRDQEYKLTTDTLEYDAKEGQGKYLHGGRVVNTLSNETLSSKVGYFHPESKNFFFSRNVKYDSPDIKMTTDTLKYHYHAKKTYFYGPTDIQNQGTKIHCENGWYNVETGEGEIVKNAWIKRENDFISGDTLFYNPNEGYYIGKGNVTYKDSLEKMSFYGDYAFNSDSLKYSLLTGHALAEKVSKDDTLLLHADTIYSYGDSAKTLKAWNSAKLFSNDVQAKADSIVYIQDSNRMELFYEPIVWLDRTELKGEFIQLLLKDSTIRKAEVRNSSSILMEVEKDIYYNQIGGKNMDAFFNNGEVNLVEVDGNAMTIFIPVEEKEEDSTRIETRIALNKVLASKLRIYIDSNEITGITYLDQPEGIIYPMDQVKSKDQFIPGFKWNYHLKPIRREDLFLSENPN